MRRHRTGGSPLTPHLRYRRTTWRTQAWSYSTSVDLPALSESTKGDIALLIRLSSPTPGDRGARVPLSRLRGFPSASRRQRKGRDCNGRPGGMDYNEQPALHTWIGRSILQPRQPTAQRESRAKRAHKTNNHQDSAPRDFRTGTPARSLLSFHFLLKAPEA